MRARITVALVAILAVALAIAGIASFVLTRRATARSAAATVLGETRQLTRLLGKIPLAQDNPDNGEISNVIKATNDISRTHLSVLVIASHTGANSIVAVPKLRYLRPADLNASALLGGHTISGTTHHVAFAAVPFLSTKLPGFHETLALELESPINTSADNVWYFLLAGGISLVVAGVLAAVITKRISRHVVAAAGAARRIAGGDFSTRVVPTTGYPELTTLATSINSMASDLESARALDRQFLLSVSHDLRTPLTSIRGYSEAIADGATPDPGRAAGIVVGAAQRLERLIGDLLDLAKLDARQFSLHLERIDAIATIANAAEGLRYEFEATGVTLEVSAAHNEIMVLADADRLGQIVANLVENALKFARSRVGVEIDAVGSDIVLSVTDDGKGISRDDLPHVFERHFSPIRTGRRAAGSGLGLTIVAELSAAMGGGVSVDSPVGEAGGTAMTVALPLEPA